MNFTNLYLLAFLSSRAVWEARLLSSELQYQSEICRQKGDVLLLFKSLHCMVFSLGLVNPSFAESWDPNEEEDLRNDSKQNKKCACCGEDKCSCSLGQAGDEAGGISSQGDDSYLEEESRSEGSSLDI